MREARHLSCRRCSARTVCASICASIFLAGASLARADTIQGSVFISGHDSDFHSQSGPNATGAQHIIDAALTFARNGNSNPILLIETDPAPNDSLGDHLDSEQGLIASGYTAGNTPGNHYIKVSAAQFATENLSQFSAIFVPSDHGGSLTGDDLEALDNRATAILNYINAGGGLVAFPEDGFHSGTTDGSHPALFGFLPFAVSSSAAGQFESGNTLTAAGVALGLTNSDINGNFSHIVFTATGGMTVVDTTPNGDILSLDFRGQLTPGGAAPEPTSLALAGVGVLVLILRLSTK